MTTTQLIDLPLAHTCGIITKIDVHVQFYGYTEEASTYRHKQK